VLWLISHHHPGWIVPWVVLMVAALAVVLVVKGYPADQSGQADDRRSQDR
jgi:hypothetical protein